MSNPITEAAVAAKALRDVAEIWEQGPRVDANNKTAASFLRLRANELEEESRIAYDELEMALNAERSRSASLAEERDKWRDKATNQAAELNRLLVQAEALRQASEYLGTGDAYALEQYRKTAESLNLTGPEGIRKYVRGMEDELFEANEKIAELTRHLMDLSGGEW